MAVKMRQLSKALIVEVYHEFVTRQHFPIKIYYFSALTASHSGLNLRDFRGYGGLLTDTVFKFCSVECNNF